MYLMMIGLHPDIEFMLQSQDLKVDLEKKPCIRVIQENSIKSYVKIVDGGLYFIFSFHFILFYFSFSFLIFYF